MLFLLSEAVAPILLPDVGAPVDHCVVGLACPAQVGTPVDHCVVGLACPAQVRHGLGRDDIGQ